MSDIRAAMRGEARKRHNEHTGATIPVAPAGGHYGQVALPVDQNGQIGTSNLPYNGATCAPTGVGTRFTAQANTVIPGGQSGGMRLKQMTQVVRTGGQADKAKLAEMIAK